MLTCPSLLQPQPLQDVSELVLFAQVGQFDVDAGSQSSPQVGWTGEDVAQVFVPHELMTSLLEQALDLEIDRGRDRKEREKGGFRPTAV